MQPVKIITLDCLIPQQRYTRDQISPHFWPNGKILERDDWKRLTANGFKDLQAQDCWFDGESG
jgi:hypothetical protein